MLKLFIKTSVFVLAVLFAALPVMACAVPNAAMTTAERACCKKMAEQCGQAAMDMANSHPCCQTTAAPADFQAVKTAFSPSNHFGLIPINVIPLTSQSNPYRSPAQLSSQISGSQSPPGLGSTTITILRV